jgi:hypothetical protein
MSSVPEWYVNLIRNLSVQYVSNVSGIKKDEIELIDNYYHTDLPKDATKLEHLGRSIQQISEADKIIIIEDGHSSRGISIEREIFDMYRIPINYQWDIAQYASLLQEGMPTDFFFMEKKRMDTTYLSKNSKLIDLIPTSFRCYGRPHSGYTLEVMTDDVIRPVQFRFLRFLQEYTDFNVYGLRHADDDMSEPYTIEKSVLINRFGWFITKEEIPFIDTNEHMFTKEFVTYHNVNMTRSDRMFNDAFAVKLYRRLREFGIK